ncbi:MAG: hypothetical protein FJ116_05975 [Deltaproteobacteria bacterium]|nr:hypothetical protein [Deltaproteobacteria bacterium]
MGFYIELKKTGDSDNMFLEQSPPQVFWTLYGLAGFALTCMGLASHSLLITLLSTGDPWDLLLVGSVFSTVPIYLLIGIKLVWIRKFITFNHDNLEMGFYLGSRRFFISKLDKQNAAEVLLVNERPSANVAPVQHDNSQYYIRGHWRLLVKTKDGKDIILDRHTEKGALHSLQNKVRSWASKS